MNSKWVKFLTVTAAASAVLGASALIAGCADDGQTEELQGHSVTFVADGVVVAKEYYTNVGDVIEEPEVPYKAGYTGTWEEYTLTGGNVSVRAIYIPDVYSITFIADGVTVDVMYYSIFTDSASFNAPSVPEKEGYTGEWEEFYLSSGDMTVNAEYTPIEYTVTFMAEGEVVGVVPYTVTTGRITEPEVPEKDGYTGEWEEYELDSKNKTVNAVYEPIEYTATFVADGGTVAEVPFTVENTAIIVPDVPLKYGYSGVWQDYELGAGNLTINAVYTEIPDNGLKFTLSADKSFYSVTGYSGSFERVVIPDTYNGLRVTAVSDGLFTGDENLREVVLPESIDEIGNDAFAGCVNLQSVTIPDSIRTIGDGAFSGCSSLTSADLGGMLETLGARAFEGCASMQSVEFGENLATVGEFAFDGCSSLVSAYLPNSVSSLGTGAFRNNTSLQYVNIPSGISSIPRIAFQNCSSLRRVTIPSGISSIGESAFSCCTSMSSLTIEGNVSVFGNSAFYRCEGLSSIYYNSSASGSYDIYSYVFYNAGRNTAGLKLQLGSSAVVPAGLFDAPSESVLPYITSIVVESGAQQVNYTMLEHGFPSIRSVSIPSSVTTLSEDFIVACSSARVEDGGVYYLGQFAVGFGGSQSHISLRDDTVSIMQGAFENGGSITSLTVPDSVEYISRGALSGCTSLQTLSLPYLGSSSSDSSNAYLGYLFGATSYSGNPSCVPSSLTSVTVRAGYVGDYAFSGLTSLREVVLPQNMTAVSAHLFDGCTSLSQVVIPSGVSSIGDYTFNGCTSLGEIAIPQGVTSIGQYAFSDCSVLTNVSLPGDLTSLSSHLFDGCTALAEIVIPSGVSSIGDYAFNGCSSLREITIPQGVTSIGQYAFSGCDAEIAWDGTPQISSIGSYAFAGYLGTGLEIPSSVTSISRNAVNGCNNLNTLTVPFVGSGSGSYSHFGYIFGASSYSSNSSYVPSSLSTVIITGGSEIGDYAFYGCEYIRSIALSQNTAYIGDYAFNGCSSLGEIAIPQGVTSIGQYAFSGCNAEIVWEGTPQINDIGSYAFAGYLGTGLEIPSSVTSISRNAVNGCNNLNTLTIPFVGSGSGDGGYSHFGYIFGASSYSSNSSYVPSSLSTVIITGGSEIGDYAFYGCEYIRSIALSQNTAYIGDYAFNGCSSLGEIAIPQGVTSIGQYAFSGCNAEIVWEGTPQINDIGSYAFAGYLGAELEIPSSVTSISRNALNGCNNLNTLTIPFVGSGSGSYSHFGYIFGASGYSSNSSYIPSSLTTVIITGGSGIGDYAFYNCYYITRIVIPSTVYSIGSNAFYGCNSLVCVFYEGEESAWNGISGYDNVTATVYYYSESEIYDGNYWHYDEYGMPVTW